MVMEKIGETSISSKEPKEGLQKILEQFFKAAGTAIQSIVLGKKIKGFPAVVLCYVVLVGVVSLTPCLVQKKKKKKRVAAENSKLDQVEIADFNVLPEGCICKILSFTTPLDVCRFSVLSTVFRSAAESDDLWEKFLPSDYEEIISRSSLSIIVKFMISSKKEIYHHLCDNFSSKKEFYHHLCDNPILIDNGNKSITLDRRSGKKCILFGVRNLDITWQCFPEYWRFRANYPGSRLAEVAELLCVCRLEIKGSLETRFLSPNTLYVAYIVFKFQENNYGFDPASRGNVEVKTMFGEEGKCMSSGRRSFYFDSNPSRQRRERSRVLQNIVQYPIERGDGWMEIEMGYLYNDSKGTTREVQIKELD